MNNLIIELKDIQTDLNEPIQDLKKDKEEDINYIKSINNT